MPGVGTKPEDINVGDHHGTEPTLEAAPGAAGAQTTQTVPPGGGGDGDSRQEDTEQLACGSENEEDGDLEVLVDTALDASVAPTRSSVQRNTTVNSVEMPKSRAIYAIFTSGTTTTRMSTDRLRRVMGQPAIVSPATSLLADDGEPACAINMWHGDPLVARVALSKEGNGVLGLFAATRAPASDDPHDAKRVYGALLRLEYERVEATDSSDSD